jgi:hypothetical protein
MIFYFYGLSVHEKSLPENRAISEELISEIAFYLK